MIEKIKVASKTIFICYVLLLPAFSYLIYDVGWMTYPELSQFEKESSATDFFKLQIFRICGVFGVFSGVVYLFVLNYGRIAKYKNKKTSDDIGHSTSKANKICMASGQIINIILILSFLYFLFFYLLR